MLYWDSSAIVSVALNEKSGPNIHSYIESLKFKPTFTSFLTFLEIESAIQRKIKDRSINQRVADQGRAIAVGFRKTAEIIISDLMILDSALHMQKIYGLRPGDAVQLASARHGTDDPSKVHFLCLDKRLNESAKREGFNVPF